MFLRIIKVETRFLKLVWFLQA